MAETNSRMTDDQAAEKECLRRLKEGQIVGFATETVWGLGVLLPFKEKLAERKGRSFAQAFQVSLADFSDLSAFVEADSRLQWLSSYWPGPLTLIMRASKECPEAALSNGGVGLRVPDAPLLQRILKHGPLLTTSLNPSGQTPATTRKEAICYGLADFLLEDLFQREETYATGQASTVLRLAEQIEVIRSGQLMDSLQANPNFYALSYRRNHERNT